MTLSSTCQTVSCHAMPDVAQQPHVGPKGTLNWVGMSGIELPIYVLNQQQQRIQTLARIQAYVNLIDPNSKGIHMSRLYLALDNILSLGELNPALLQQVVGQFVNSHDGLSNAGYLECCFNYFEKRPSLKSHNQGWKNYAVKVIAVLRAGQLDLEVVVDVPYSSTCPCSAALARQIIQEGFEQQFGLGAPVNANVVYDWLGTVEGISATPHSQRSMAQVRVKLVQGAATLPIIELINRIEDVLKTPVQAAVKREDEQEFARLNAANLMFCEDAARRVKAALHQDNTLQDFWVRVNHLESLHAHDAVSIVVKGIANGYSDTPGDAYPC